MPAKSLIIKTAVGVRTITMNRPEVMNAITEAMIEEFQAVFDDVATNENVRIVVIEGAGGNFSSGADMFLLDSGWDAPKWHAKLRRLSRLLQTMRDLPQPVISKVRGMAVGGGANLAFAGDFVFAADNARFQEVFVDLGVTLDFGGTFYLPRLVGLVRARRLAFLGEAITGREAHSMGLIHESTPEKSLDQAVASFCRFLMKKSFVALALIKGGLDRSFNMNPEEAFEWEASHQAIALQDKAFRKNVKAYLKSRSKI
jgi:enoyl-CoA hydratase/carnithine racemase